MPDTVMTFHSLRLADDLLVLGSKVDRVRNMFQEQTEQSGEMREKSTATGTSQVNGRIRRGAAPLGFAPGTRAVS